LSTGIQLVSGVGPSSNVQYTTPTILGITIAAAVAPSMGHTDTADKSSSGVNTANKGKGYDLTVNLNPSLGTEILSGLNLFAGGHYTEVGRSHAAGNNDDNRYEAVAGITYDIGPVSIGGGRSGILTGKTQGSTDVDYYRNNMYGVAFNINDNLSVSYGKHESEQNFVNPNGVPGTSGEAVTMEVSSIQLAYTMGGASIRIAESKVDNKEYQTTASADQSATTISVSLAF